MDTHNRRRSNLRALIAEQYGGVQARLAEAIGRPANYVWRLVSEGPHAKNIGEELARLIEVRSGKPLHWLDAPEARALLKESTETPGNVSPATSPGPRRIPIVTSDEVLRTRGFALGGVPEGVTSVYSDYNMSERAFAMVVNGTDMAPDFAHGERVIFDPTASPRAGDFVLARVEQSLLFRRYRPKYETSRGAVGTFELLACNSDYGPIWSDKSSVEILAVMVEHHRSRQAKH